MEYGLIGEKLGHSFSKTVHSFLADYLYELCEIPKTELKEFMEKADFKAINVTIPYKSEVIPYLYFIDEKAKQIGAVNTVVNKDGRLYGYNTDYYGLKALIEFARIDIEDKKVLILGSGGTSKTAFFVAKDLGAKKILTVTRTEKQGFITYSDAENLHNDADIIINATPCGMYPDIENIAIDISSFQRLSGVVDVIYNPLRSALVLEAQKRGIKAIGGLYMLIAQAVFAAEKFLGRQIPKAKIKEIYSKILKEKSNIVLTGMPSCGKTSLGKRISKILGKEFLDTDVEIERQTGMAIRDIFESRGEEYFRSLETKVIKEISTKNNKIISTGGGAVLKNENVKALKHNGMVFFIDRPLKDLMATSDRPLSSSKADLKKRYNERYDIYRSAADKKIINDRDFEAAVTKIKEAFSIEDFSN